jgi:hypothetical protein
MSILDDGSLAEEIAEGLAAADIPFDVTLLEQVVSGPPHNPTIDYVDHPCKGFAESYDNLLIAASAVQANDVKVMVLATTLDITPTTADRVSVRGVSYSIISVSTDPAGALFELQARA